MQSKREKQRFLYILATLVGSIAIKFRVFSINSVIIAPFDLTFSGCLKFIFPNYIMKTKLFVLLMATAFSASAAPEKDTAPKKSATPTAKAASAPAAPNLNVAKAQKGVPTIEATAYIVKDLQSGQVLLSKDADQLIEPASLTKLMTAYIVFKQLNEGKLKPDQMLKVSDKAWKAEGSRMFFETKKPVSVADLIKGLIVQSGNDAAITLAEGIAGSEAKFVALMNEQAKQLGMTQTTFENSTGLPSKKHLTTVNDLVTLSAAIIKNYPDYYAIYSLKEFTYNGIKQPNRNLLLFRDPSVDGLKTGHTNSAGYNLIASSKRNGRRVVSVVVGTSSQEARATESSKLLNYALQNFDTPKMYQAGQAVSHIKVFKGALREVPIGFLEDEYITLPHGQGQDIKPKLETRQPVLAPIKKGAEMGVIKFIYQDKVLAEKKVYALQDVAEAGFVGKFWDSITLWFNEIFAG